MTRLTPQREPDRFLIVPCGEDIGLSIIWDRVEECVVDVVDTTSTADATESLL